MNIQRVDTLKSASPEATTVDDSDFDLRPYLKVLFLWWREIALVALVTAIIGAAFVVALRVVTPPVYETSADVIMDRVVSNVNLVDSFTTTTEGSVQATSSGNARREALVHLVRSGAIAEAVIADLDSLLSEDERMPAILLRMVEAEAPIGADSRTISDLIRIKVKADTGPRLPPPVARALRPRGPVARRAATSRSTCPPTRGSRPTSTDVKITVAVVGRLKEDYLRAAEDEYRKRLRPYCTLDVIEHKTIEALLAAMPPAAHLYAFDERGELISSAELAKDILAAEEMHGGGAPGRGS